MASCSEAVTLGCSYAERISEVTNIVILTTSLCMDVARMKQKVYLIQLSSTLCGFVQVAMLHWLSIDGPIKID